MNRVLHITSVGLVLLLSLVGTLSATEGQALGHSPRCSSILPEKQVEYDLPAMRMALAELTHWDVTNWPVPQILQLTPEAFQDRTELDHHRFVGDYDPQKNRVFVNLTCRCQAPDHPEAFCRAVLFHELVHWGQHKLGIDKVMSATDQERQALEYEARYLETRLGIPDVYAPDRPTPAELPPLSKPIRLTRLQPRTTVQDETGQPQALWILTGVWSDVPSQHEYWGQAIAHRGHWVGVEIFEANSSTGLPELLEAWWDAGYVRHHTAFPAYPVYRGQWVQVK
jgi:hypothetical protein